MAERSEVGVGEAENSSLQLGLIGLLGSCYGERTTWSYEVAPKERGAFPSADNVSV